MQGTSLYELFLTVKQRVLFALNQLGTVAHTKEVTRQYRRNRIKTKEIDSYQIIPLIKCLQLSFITLIDNINGSRNHQGVVVVVARASLFTACLKKF